MTRVIGAFIVVCVVFGTTFGAIKIGIDDGWPPFLAAGARFALAGLIVMALGALRGELRRPSMSDVVTVVLVGVTVTVAVFGTLYNAELFLPSGLAAVLSAGTPLFSVVLAIRAGRRRLDGSILAGTLCGTIGLILLARIGVGGGIAAILGACAIIASEMSYAWGLTIARERRTQLSTLMFAGAQQFVGGIVLLGLSAIFEHRLPVRIDSLGIISLAYLIIVASALAHTLVIWVAQQAGPTFAASWSYISPFFALLIGSFVLHEPLTIGVWLGGCLVVLGAFALNRDAGVQLRSLQKRSAPA